MNHKEKLRQGKHFVTASVTTNHVQRQFFLHPMWGKQICHDDDDDTWNMMSNIKIFALPIAAPNAL
jgi:hypothetical protein